MKNLLVAVDFSTTTDFVLKEASVLAKELNAKLWILHVVANEAQALPFEAVQYCGYDAVSYIPISGDVQFARDICAEEIKREHAELLHISTNMRENGIDAQAILLKGNPIKLIIEKANDLNIDIIVLGSHGHGILHKALLGSVSEAIIHQAKRNVLIVPVRSGDS